MKKIVPDPPHSAQTKLSTVGRDLVSALNQDKQKTQGPGGNALASLGTTTRKPAGKHSLFMVREGASAEETLLHVSLLLLCAEEVSDEITEEGSGFERGLIWSMIHSVEMARSLVDALLDGRSQGSKNETLVT